MPNKTKAKTVRKKRAQKKKAPTKRVTSRKTRVNKKRKPVTSKKSTSHTSSRRVGNKRLLDKDKKKYTEMLLSLRDKINGRIHFLSNNSLNKEGYDVPPDDGTEDFERDFALNLLSSEQDVMFEIEQAMRRIDSGDYGACADCGKLISKTRLEAVPFAKMCIRCQSKLERNRLPFRPFGQTMMSSEAKSDAVQDRSPAADE